LRISPAPCSSHVLEDSVIRTRMKRVLTGALLNLRVTVPPRPVLNTPVGKTFHSPFGPKSKSNASPPVQYSTWYRIAYGFSHWIRTALTGFSFLRSTTTHCGCNSSLSWVNLLVRYGLLFQ